MLSILSCIQHFPTSFPILYFALLELLSYEGIFIVALLHQPKRKMRQTHSNFRWLEALPSVKSTDGLTFSISSFLFEMVKDEIQNSLGLCCL